MPLFARWRTERDFQRKAERFVELLLAEPDDDDVRWLAQTATHGDTDHARWEQAFSEDGGQTWETNWIMESTRIE